MGDMRTPRWQGWETVGMLGQGSFGTVYEIRRDMLGDGEYERAALKVISIPQNQSDIDEMVNDGYDLESIKSSYQKYLKSILGEYSLMRKMNGSSFVVNCDDVHYEPHADGIGWDVFIKMELLTPMTRSFGTSLTEQQVIKIGKDLCSALILCRKHDIVHRDIKPQNIFFSPNGDYKLGDFGISKTMEKTSSGTKVGTYRYMAPEVYHNQPYGSAADIYSLGLVLYWLLNERRMPFVPLPPAKIDTTTDNQCQLRRLSGEPIPAPAHGSDGLKWIVLKACAHDQATRYDSAEKMLQDLQLLEDGKLNAPPIVPRPYVAPTPPVAPPQSPVSEYPPVAPASNRSNTNKTIGIMPGSMEDPLNQTPSSRGRTPNGTIGIIHGSVDDPPSVQPNPPSVRPDPPSVQPDPPKPAPAPKPEKKAKSPVKWIIIGAAALVLCVIVTLLSIGPITKSVKLKEQYAQAEELLQNDKYQEAIEKFSALGNYSDAEERLNEARYEYAKELLKDELYAEAIEQLEQVGNYKDASQLLSNTRYHYGKTLLQSENYGEAVAQLEKIPDYEDAADYLKAARYNYGLELLSAKDYAGAAAQFEQITDYSDAAEQLKEANYKYGSQLMNEGSITEAIDIFTALGSYKESASWVKYGEAEQMFASGNYGTACLMFASLGNIGNAKLRETDSRYHYAQQLIRIGDPAEAINQFNMVIGYADTGSWLRFAEAELAYMQGDIAAAAVAFGKLGNFENARERANAAWSLVAVRNTIAAGDGHTVALKPDGTVIAVGEPKQGQCNVGDWTNITAVDANRSHTVGLREDGTVVATGKADSGVCDVENWTDIVAIAAGRFHTVGLKADGTVVATWVKDNENNKGQSNVSGWTDVVAIAAGFHHTVGLRADGTVVAVGDDKYGQCQVSEWTDIVAIAAGGWHTIGLKADGTVVAIGYKLQGRCEVGGWTDVVAVAANDYQTVGLRRDGTVVATGKNDASGAEGICDVSSWRNIVVIFAGHNNTLGLKKDGTLVMVGGNKYGQMEANGWTGIQLPQ